MKILKENSILKILNEELSDSTKEEFASYLYDESDGEVDEIPSYEETNDYIVAMDKKEYKVVSAMVKEAIENVADHFYNDKIELSDNATLNDLRGDFNEADADEVQMEYGNLVEQAFKNFQEETGVEAWQDGRMGRHIVVDNNFYNAYHYNELCEAQSKWENWVIDEMEKRYPENGLTEAIVMSRLIDNDMTVKELDDTANWLYKYDRNEWDKFTDAELIELAKLCQITDKNPGGRAYDDEVFDEMDRRGLELSDKDRQDALEGITESTEEHKKAPERRYTAYVFNWVNDHGYSKEFKKVWEKYATPEYDGMSTEEIMQLVFDELADENGFNGELFVSPSEFFNNEDKLKESTEPKVRVACNINWETDGDKEALKSLPKCVELPDDISEDEVANYLSDQYGWLVNSVDVKNITKDTDMSKLEESVEEKKIVNPDEKDFYDGKLWRVCLYPGAGVELSVFYAYANYEEQALNKVVAYCEDTAPGLLYTSKEIEKEINDSYKDELTSDMSYFDFATDYLGYVYVDATEEGAKDVYFVDGNNLRIELVEDINEEVTMSGTNEVKDTNGTPKKVKDYLDYELEDDDTATGGTSFAGEKVKDFIGDTDIKDDDNLDTLNKALVSCGIKPITESYSSEIKEITSDEAEAYIDAWDGRGENPYPDYSRFIAKSGDKYIAIDDRSGDCWTEEFDSKEKALDYLNDKINADGSPFDADEGLEESVDKTTAEKMCDFIGGLFSNMSEDFESNSESLSGWCEDGDTFRNAGYSEEECKKLDKLMAEIDPLVDQIIDKMYEFAGEGLTESVNENIKMLCTQVDNTGDIIGALNDAKDDAKVSYMGEDKVGLVYDDDEDIAYIDKLDWIKNDLDIENKEDKFITDKLGTVRELKDALKLVPEFTFINPFGESRCGIAYDSKNNIVYIDEKDTLKYDLMEEE